MAKLVHLRSHLNTVAVPRAYGSLQLMRVPEKAYPDGCHFPQERGPTWVPYSRTHTISVIADRITPVRYPSHTPREWFPLIFGERRS